VGVYLTNVNTSPGTYVNEGEQLLALVDAGSFGIAAYFKVSTFAMEPARGSR
jgi:multidrug resistance efflux pump